MKKMWKEDAIHIWENELLVIFRAKFNRSVPMGNE